MSASFAQGGLKLSKASAFDNAQAALKRKKPLRDNELTDSIEVKS